MGSRSKFFAEVLTKFPPSVDRVDLVLVTHLLPDRRELLPALVAAGYNVLLISVPYSEDPTMVAWVRQQGIPIRSPTLGEMMNSQEVVEVLESFPLGSQFIIGDIGGYFSEALQILKSRYGHRFMGIVEDTEHGHRRYLAARPVAPVVSVARAAMKIAEDRLVGTSVVYSLETMLRNVGSVLSGQRVLILGFGKVGRGVATELRSRGAHVMVYDTSAVRMVSAQSEGFATPSRIVAISTADIIVGATGTSSMHATDVPLLRMSTRLASASSKNVEFMNLMDAGLAVSQGHSWGDEDVPTVLYDGLPINFLHGAEIGPALALVQAGLIVGFSLTSGRHLVGGMHEIPAAVSDEVASIWIQHFVDPDAGCVSHGTSYMPEVGGDGEPAVNAVPGPLLS